MTEFRVDSLFGGVDTLSVQVLSRRGFAAELLDYEPRTDSVVVIILLLAAALLFIQLRRLNGRFLVLLRDFLFPSNNADTLRGAENNDVYVPRHSTFLSLSLTTGLLLYIHIGGSEVAPWMGVLFPYILAALCVLTGAGYFLLKNVLYSFVNWVFFSPSERRVWHSSYTFIYMVESVLILLSLLMIVFLNISTETAGFILLLALVLAKIVLIYKTFSVFFRSIYGCLHLIVYFCTLEALPVLVILKLLTKFAVIPTGIL